MGYDLTRFVGDLDEEFHCSICSMVFENPIETPCGHAFCNECIITWLSANVTCPIDRAPLSQSDLKTPGRVFTNLLAKLKIKCNFVVEGCEMIVELGNMQQHIAICKFNLNSEVTCDRGCNGKISRREHQTHNCLTHLSNVIGELMNECRNLRLATAICHQKPNTQIKKATENEIRLLKELMGNQEEQITKLKKVVEAHCIEIRRIREQMANQKDQITKLEAFVEKHNLELNEGNRRFKERMLKPNENQKLSTKWKIGNSLRFLSNILECQSEGGRAQSNYFLRPEITSFVVEIFNISSGGLIRVGLTIKDECFLHIDSICYENTGFVKYSGEVHCVQQKYVVGDLIECGIKYSQNFNLNQSQDVIVYFLKNGNLVHEHKRTLPSPLFPTISLFGTGTKVKVH